VKAIAWAGFLAAALAVVAAGGASDGLPRCAKAAPDQGPSGLPATLSLETRCADFRLEPDGGLRALAVAPASRGSISFADGISWRLIRGRLAAYSGEHRLWRSSRRYPRLFDLQSAAVGARAVALAYRSRLFVAAGGPNAVERPVARNERPLGWSRDGLLFTLRGGELRLRNAAGRLVAVVEPSARAVRYDPATRSVLLFARYGRVERFDGRVVTELADLHELGMPITAWIEPLAGGLVGISTQRRVAILRSDGSFFASARFPGGRRWNAVGNSGLVADPGGTAVALTMTEGNTGHSSDGAEWLLVLREGDRVARVLRREQLTFAVCERWTTLAWRDGWLLYSSTEGRTLALDTSSRRVVDLTPLVARLPGAQPDGELEVELDARWASA
jgi:hypothetical protein